MPKQYQEYKSKGYRWRIKGRNNKKLANGGEGYKNEKDMRKAVVLVAKVLLSLDFVQEALRIQPEPTIEA